MTPTSPAVAGSRHMPLTLTATAPIHHGAGTAGNTALLRTQEVVLPDGTQTAVPFVSGNSLRHAIRDALAWRLVRVLDIPGQSLSKGVVDLLWSGGALTKTGAQVDLGLARRLQLVPPLGLLGYSAQSDIVTGVLRVDNLNLVCAENGWRLPPRLSGHPHATQPAGRFRGEEFGTRHDITSSPVDVLVASGMLDTAPPPTTQMIYEHQVLIPGSELWGALRLDAPTDLHVDAIHTAITDLTVGGVLHIGARRAAGFGSCSVDIGGVDPTATARIDAHLTAHGDTILAALRDATT